MLATDIAATAGAQLPEDCLAQGDAIGLQLDARLRLGIEPGVQLQGLDPPVGERQLPALRLQLPLGRLQAAGEFQLPLKLPLQLRPQLAEARQGQLQLAAQTLLQFTAALDAVVTQAQIDPTQRPAIPRALDLGLQPRRLTAQTPRQVDIRIQAQTPGAQLALAVQRTGQLPRKLGQPVGRIEVLQLQASIPAQALGEVQAELTLGPALAGLQAQLGQKQLLQVAAEWTLQAEGTGRALQLGAEVAEVVAALVGQLALQHAQAHRRLFELGQQAAPGKILPVETSIEAQRLLPVDPPAELQALFGTGAEAEVGDIGASGIDPAVQRHGQGPALALARQPGAAADPVAVGEIAARLYLNRVQAQGLRQLAAGQESIGDQACTGRQVRGHGLHLAGQPALQVAAAVGAQLQAAEQVAIHLQRQLPILLRGRRQSQPATGAERPVAAGQQAALQVEVQRPAAQLQLVDLQALGAPMGLELQALQLFIAIDQQAIDAQFTEAHGQGQLQFRQRKWLATVLVCRWQVQLDSLGLQALDAQGQVPQAAWRPGQHRRVQAQPRLAALPVQRLGLPAAAQSPGESAHLQAGYPLQGPAAARLAAKQPGQCRQRQADDNQQAIAAVAPAAPHSSGPMEKCRRTPPCSSSGWARSRRSGPTGDTQRRPMPTALFRLEKSSELKLLP